MSNKTTSPVPSSPSEQPYLAASPSSAPVPDASASATASPFVIHFKKLRHNAILPKRITDGSAAYDAIIPTTTKLSFGRQIIPLGFAIAMPPCLKLDCRTRAGYAAKGLVVLTASREQYRIDAIVEFGLIDSDYRNECGIILTVTDPFVLYNDCYVTAGQALAQLDFGYVPPTQLQWAEELPPSTRIGGFGKQNNE